MSILAIITIAAALTAMACYVIHTLILANKTQHLTHDLKQMTTLAAHLIARLHGNHSRG